MRLMIVSAMLAATAASGETLVLEVENGVHVIRWRPTFNATVVEYISEAPRVRCIALNAEGDPIAARTAPNTVGENVLMNILPEDIDRVVCEALPE